MQAISTDSLAIQAFQSIKKHWKEFLVLPTAISAGWWLLGVAAVYLSFGFMPQLGGFTVITIGIAATISMLTFFGATSIWCEKIFQGKNEWDIGEDLKLAFKRVWGTLGTQILTLIKIILWAFLLLIPGYYKAIQYMLSIKAAHIEGVYGNAANARSRELVMGQGWLQTLGSMMSVSMVGFVVFELSALLATGIIGVIGAIMVKESRTSQMIIGGLGVCMLYILFLILIMAYSNFMSFMFLNYRAQNSSPKTPIRAASKPALKKKVQKA